jgi:predicted PurR-regulated permease PerM
MDSTRPGAAVWTIGVHATAFAATLYVLWRAAPFLRLVAVAMILAAALESPVSELVRRGWKRWAAITTASVTALGVIAAILAILVPRIVPQVQRAAEAAPEVVARLQSSPEYRWINEHDMFDRAVDQGRQHAGAALGTALAAAVGVLSLAADFVTVVALTVFLLASGPVAWSWLLTWAHPRRRARIRRVAVDARRAVAGYVAGALVMGTVAGVVTAVTTGFLGVPFFLALAVLTAVLGLLPFVGALISGALVVIATFATAGTTPALIALGVFVVYQQLEGTVLQPIVQRYTTSMNPLVVVVAVLLGTSAAGIFGGVVALPAAAAAKVVANDVRSRRRSSWRRRTAPAAGESGEASDARH